MGKIEKKRKEKKRKFYFKKTGKKGCVEDLSMYGRMVLQ
jgi:hypothetical protein